MRSGSVIFWAWMASVAVHLIVLGVFGFVKFSQSVTEQEVQIRPAVRISQMKRLIEAAPIVPKPKIKRAGRGQLAEAAEIVAPISEIFDRAVSGLRTEVDFAEASGWTSEVLQGERAILAEGVDFFGSKTQERKVCFLVDCSGSMRGMFSRVRKELKKSLGNLQQDQYFYIIFFGSDRLYEFGDNRLVRANAKSKSAACDFIDTIEPAGHTNALAALQRAMQIRDRRGKNASVIYFLTDGFELSGDDARWFLLQTANLRKRLAEETIINTIGFWPQDDERKILEALAAESGGKSVFITE